MREFMDYILRAFSRASGATQDNSYSDLNETANKLLNFPTPRGLRLTLSSLATPNFATSYHLGTVGVVDGSISYLYSTVPLSNTVVVQSDRIPLPELLRSYRQLSEIASSSSVPASNSPFLDFFRPAAAAIPEPTGDAVTPARDLNGAAHRHRSASHGHKHTLMYGRLYLPKSMLEALIARRLTPNLGVQLVAVSQEKIRHGGTLLGLLQYSEPRFGLEGLASTDGGLLGLRGVYNFGGDVSPLPFSGSAPALSGASATAGAGEALAVGEGERDRERIYGRFSAGGEVYYGTLNKSGGMSVGARFQTLPTHKGTPLTATLTINPLMGNISTSYAVVARSYCTLATRMEFNVYSYESDWAVGMELWSKRRSLISGENDEGEKEVKDQVSPVEPAKKSKLRERSFQAKLEWRLDDPESDDGVTTQPAPGDTLGNGNEEEYLGVLKARLDQHLRIGLLWEGRVKSLLFSLGTGIDLRRLDQPFRTLGLEVQFSS
ncbi:putative mitochondrial inheritance component mdm10 protein [Phaeoacremonium minimum UCRPA7]|uniref:Mitochondrial distribution and morphology protein 10 n=1 Tax=Phaeoacremonium minimum (strain UCR-PA7) TaxID=1286976 RepID=R8BIK3_PHAM7|nr:putative mitochondrial inheritance component mdm10 protein [Phaeoacremonium minimum UCRPA7]EON99141.1 putative mitochondrial inheritance component mdm10 protein [Phaeoacremonium minimum UCRPA7]